MNYLICDESGDNRRLIREWLEKSEMSKESRITEYDNGYKAIMGITGKDHPSICLLYANSEKMNGYEIMETLRRYRKDALCILYSENDHDAVGAWRMNADGFLKLPFIREDFNDMLDRCQKKYCERDNEYLFLRFKSGRYHVLKRDIMYVESGQRHLFWHMKDGSILETPGRMDFLAEKLSMNGRFIRVHKSMLVNTDSIRRCTAKEVELVTGEIFRFSRRLKKNEDEKSEPFATYASVTRPHATMSQGRTQQSHLK